MTCREQRQRARRVYVLLLILRKEKPGVHLLSCWGVSTVGSSLPKTAPTAEAFPSGEAPNQNLHVCLSMLRTSQLSMGAGNLDLSVPQPLLGIKPGGECDP